MTAGQPAGDRHEGSGSAIRHTTSFRQASQTTTEKILTMARMSSRHIAATAYPVTYPVRMLKIITRTVAARPARMAVMIGRLMADTPYSGLFWRR